MQSQFEELGLEFEFIDAVDGRQLSEAELAYSYDRPSTLRRMRRDLGPGEIGCSLSHYRLYCRMVCDGLDEAIILEDDITLGPEFAQVVRSGSLRKTDLELILLTGRAVSINWGARPLEGTAARLYRMFRMPRGGAAYYIRGTAAQRLARGVFPISFVADWPASVHLWPRARLAFPFLVHAPDPEVDPSSTLQAERVDLWKKLDTTSKGMTGWRRVFSWTVIPHLLWPRSYGSLGPKVDKILKLAERLGCRLGLLHYR